MKCDKKDLLLYAVTDRSWLNGETLYSQVEKALEGGATFVQLREKHLDHDAFLQEAKEIKELCAKYQVPFVLDDDVELALSEFQHRQWSRHFSLRSAEQTILESELYFRPVPKMTQ